MPRVSDIYAPPSGTLATTLTPASSAAYNAFVTDVAADLNAPRPIAAGGTGATTAAGARTALGIPDISTAQPLNANLTSLSGLTFAANKGLYTTAANTAALFDLTAAGRALLDDADAAAQRTTLGLGAAAVLGVSSNTSFVSDTAMLATRATTKTFVDATVSAALTNIEDDVLPAIASGTTGAVIGAYVFARGPSTAFGATAAGSALTPSGGISSLTTTSNPGSGTWATGVGSALSGTWRCMGVSTASFNSSGGVVGAAGTGIGATLWVRIA